MLEGSLLQVGTRPDGPTITPTQGALSLSSSSPMPVASSFRTITGSQVKDGTGGEDFTSMVMSQEAASCV